MVIENYLEIIIVAVLFSLTVKCVSFLFDTVVSITIGENKTWKQKRELKNKGCKKCKK